MAYDLFYLTDEAYNLELDKSNFLRKEEKLIIEILKDGALNINEIKEKLEELDIDLHHTTVKNRLFDLNEEGWVKVK
jgi:DNA-binding HxlR family transcriptional regulator